MNLKPEVRYAGPFVAFMALLVLFRTLPLPDLLSQILFVSAMALVIYFVAWPVVDLKVRQLGSTLGIGVLVFLIWIAPDLLSSNYRHSWLFDNSIDGPGAQRTFGTGASSTRGALLPDLARGADCACDRGVVLARLADALADLTAI